eukprot:11168276-Lingulodinium_polyedra.AAC.1
MQYVILLGRGHQLLPEVGVTLEDALPAGAHKEPEGFNGVLRGPGPGGKCTPQTREYATNHKDVLAALNPSSRIR